MTSPGSVLLVGEKPAASRETVETLESALPGFEVEAAAHVETVTDAVTDNEVSGIVITDRDPATDCLDLLERIRRHDPTIPVVLHPIDGSEQLASGAIAANVTEYIPRKEDSWERVADKLVDAISLYRLEQDQQETRQALESIFDSVPVVFFTLDLDGRFTRTRGRALERIGLTPSAAVGASIYDLFENQPAVIDHFERARSGEHVTATVELEGVVFQTWSQPIRDSDGTVSGVVGYAVDITERKRNERHLERAQTRMEIALEATDATVWEWDPDTDTVQTHPDPHYVLGRSIDTAAEFLEAIHPADRSAVSEALDAAVESATPYHAQFRLADPPSEAPRWVEDYGELRYRDDGSPYVVGIAIDITDQKERERALEQSQERLAVALEAADAGVWEWEPDTERLLWHESAERLLGLEPGEFPGTYEAFSQYIHDEDIQHVETALEAAVPAREPFDIEFRVTREDGTTGWLHTRGEFVDVDGLTSRYVGVMTDITALKRYERTLASLHDATRDLVRSSTPAAVCRRMGNAAIDVLESDGALVLRYEQDEPALVPAVVTDSGRVRTLEDESIQPTDDDPLWHTFVAGETTTIAKDESPYEALGLLPGDELLLLPLGEHGLFVVTTGAGSPAPTRQVELAEILAANAEAALDRINREQQLERRDEKLRERTAQLERLDEVNERIRHISHQLMRASSREEIATVVCEELAASERFDLVCFGEYDERQDRVEIQAQEGTAKGYFDAVSLVGDGGDEPLQTAARTGEQVVVEEIGHGFRNEQWRQEAIIRGYQSVLAIPVTLDDLTYGVLGVFATSPAAFDSDTRTVFDELGTAVAHALRTVIQRDAIASDHQVELVFAVTDGTATIFSLSKHLDATVIVERFIGGSKQLAYGRVEGTDESTVRSVVSTLPGIENVRIVRAEGEHMTIELRVTGETIAKTIADHGGSLERLEARDGSGSISIVLPGTARVGEFIDVFTAQFPNAELAARREREQAERPTSDPLEANMTPRQREVLLAAFHSGFFEWPRESTGEEIAEGLDVSPATFRETIRRGERNLITWYVNETKHAPMGNVPGTED